MAEQKEVNYTDYIEKLNSSPLFTNIAKNFDYKRVGLQITNDENVIKELTSHNKEGRIIKIEEGLKNPEVTVKIEEKTVKQMVSKNERGWIEKYPGKAAIKYYGKIEMPLIVKLKLLKILSKI